MEFQILKVMYDRTSYDQHDVWKLIYFKEPFFFKDSGPVEGILNDGCGKKFFTRRNGKPNVPSMFIFTITNAGRKAYRKEKRARRPPFREKYWWVLAIVGYGAGLITPTLQKLIERKTIKEPIQLEQTIPQKKDTQ